MRLISIVAIFFFHCCTAQTNDKKKETMEKFNVVEFNANQVDGSYTKVLEDGTEVIQSGDASGYIEKIMPIKGWFYIYKEYYGNGQLNTKGNAFKKGDFQAGVWFEYDESGKLISETNYDEPYRLTIDSVFEIIRAHEIPFSMENKYNEITREVIDSVAIWYVNWRLQHNRVETIEIVDASGKTRNRNFYLMKKN